MELVSLNMTDTIRVALEELIKMHEQKEIKKYRGKINLDINLTKVRAKDMI